MPNDEDCPKAVIEDVCRARMETMAERIEGLEKYMKVLLGGLAVSIVMGLIELAKLFAGTH